jgi:catechol 2,3-dioxygenase-like lactoylglutathione lyase family enzyme
VFSAKVLAELSTVVDKSRLHSKSPERGMSVKAGVVTQMTKPEISGIAPLFIVNNVPAALAFYRDRLGFDITFQGPEPNDIFFGIVRRGAAMIMFKAVGVDPLPNYTRDVKKGIARWDAYLNVSDPDALATEFSSRNIEFSVPLRDTDDGLRGFELKDADGYVLFFGCPRTEP